MNLNKKGNLLIIDDEELILEKLEFILKEYADTLYTATNGRDAYELIMNNEVHCIVCDINMPILNGVELIEKVREHEIETPFIFYTAHGSFDLMREAAKFGAFEFLNKPHLDGLEDIVQKGLALGIKDGEEEDQFIPHSIYQALLKEIEEESVK